MIYIHIYICISFLGVGGRSYMYYGIYVLSIHNSGCMYTVARRTSHLGYNGISMLEGPAAHLCVVSIVCRSYEKKPDYAGPPWFLGLQCVL
jgi:hypothetical protein